MNEDDEIEMKCPKCNSDMKEYVTRFKCRNASCNFVYEKYFNIELNTKLLNSLLNKVNHVTCYYRHGQEIPDSWMKELCERQIEIEEALENNKNEG